MLHFKVWAIFILIKVQLLLERIAPFKWSSIDLLQMVLVMLQIIMNEEDDLVCITCNKEEASKELTEIDTEKDTWIEEALSTLL